MAGLLAAPTLLMGQAANTETPATKPATSPTALLRAIPADATAFVAIRNLKEIDSDVVGIAGLLGFPMGPEGMFPAPLDWLKSELKIAGGLNESGGVALVLLNSKDAKTVDDLEDRMVMFIPASDPKELLKQLNAEETKGGVYKFDLMGSPSVAMVKGDFLIATKAPAKAEDGPPAALAAAAKAEGEGVIKTMSPDRVAAFAKQDLFIWLNLRTVSDELRKEITDGLTGLMHSMGGRGMLPTSQPGGDATDPTQQLKVFLEQGDEVGIGLLVNANVGLSLSFYVRVKPGSQLAGTIAAMQPPKDSLLVGLPNEAAVIAGGAVVGTTPEAIKQARATLEQLAAKAAELDPDEGSPLNLKGLKPLIDTYIQLITNTSRGAIMISNLTAGEGEKKDEDAAAAKTSEGAIGLVVVVETKDNKAFKADLKKGFEQIKEIVAGVAKADGMEAEKVEKILSGFTWKEATAQGTGPAVDTVQVELDKLPEIKAEDIEQIKSVFGEEGIVFRIASVGENHIVIALGGGEKRLTTIVTAVEKNQAPLARSRNITKVANRLPSTGRVAEVYVDFSNLLELVKSVATRLKSPLPFNISLDNAAPLAAATIAVDPTAQEVHILIPMELIKSGYTAVTQAIMGAMGGGTTIERVPNATIERAPNDGDSKGDDEAKEEAPLKPKAKPRRPAARPQPNE
jgi:hypothetical protein